MAVSHEALNRSLGRLEGHQSAMEKRLDNLESTMADGFAKMGEGLEKIEKRLATLEARETERKGAWKAICAMAAAAGGITAALFKYLTS